MKMAQIPPWGSSYISVEARLMQNRRRYLPSWDHSENIFCAAWSHSPIETLSQDSFWNDPNLSCQKVKDIITPPELYT